MIKKTYLIIFFILFALTNGCNLPERAQRKLPETYCPTSIIGEVHYKNKFKGVNSTLLLKGWLVNKKITGKIIEKTKDGFVFASYNMSCNCYPISKFYKFEDLVYLTNEQNEFVFGDYEKYKKDYLRWYLYFEIQALNDTNAKKISFYSFPNEPFSYCLEANIYKVTYLEFVIDYYKTKSGKTSHTYKYSDYTRNPNFILNIKENRINYIGDLYLDSLAEDMCVIPLDLNVGSRYSNKTPTYMYIKEKDTLYLSDKKGEINRHTLIIKNDSARYPEAVPSLLKKIQ